MNDNDSFDDFGDQHDGGPADEYAPPQQDLPRLFAAFEASITDGAAGDGHGRARPQRSNPTTFSPLDLRDRVVIKLIYEELVQIEHVEKAWVKWVKEAEKGNNTPLWRILAEDPELDCEQVFEQAAKVYSFKEVKQDDDQVEAFLVSMQERFTTKKWESLEELGVIPVALEEDESGESTRLILATHDPASPDLYRRLTRIGLKSFELRFLARASVEAHYKVLQRRRAGDVSQATKDLVALDLGADHSEQGSLLDEEALEAEINRSALINLFELTLTEAVRTGASDVHIFPDAKKQVQIHFRVDGELSRWHTEHRVNPEAFLAVVKDNCMNVDRFERERAQDGFIQRKVDGTIIRFRVSVLPIANAELSVRSESIVIRILDDRKVITDLGKLGLSDQALERFEWAIRQPYGMVILTGPTGSGKSTTLFAALSQVVTPKVNVLTIEDPVEYIIPAVRQIKLSHKLSMDQALRAILRHDPDVVMVGEMRDRQTAELAIKLANTGHLTFSTLHTNDAPSSVSRLFKMGIEPFLIAYAINLIVAQRLIRVLCPTCKVKVDKPNPLLLKHVGIDADMDGLELYDASVGSTCKTCNGVGFKGRRAITETLAFSPEMRDMIVSSETVVEEAAIKKLALEQGMTSLQDAARVIVLEGDTSVAEMMRVVFTGV